MKNKVVEFDENTLIIIINYKGQELSCFIDKEDLDKINIKGIWHITNKNNRIDGVRTKIQKNGIRKQIWMHNLILDKIDSNNIIDHIDHNPLNNRKSNLREITKRENSQNISPTLSSKTGHRNITIQNNRYRVRINNKSFGSYETLEEAIDVAKEKRKEIFHVSSELDEKIILNL